jgi:hypothetical protein
MEALEDLLERLAVQAVLRHFLQSLMPHLLPLAAVAGLEASAVAPQVEQRLVGTQTEPLAGLAAAAAAEAFLERLQLHFHRWLVELAAQRAAQGVRAAAGVELPASRGCSLEPTLRWAALAALVAQMLAAEAAVVAQR